MSRSTNHRRPAPAAATIAPDDVRVLAAATDPGQTEPTTDEQQQRLAALQAMLASLVPTEPEPVAVAQAHDATATIAAPSAAEVAAERAAALVADMERAVQETQAQLHELERQRAQTHADLASLADDLAAARARHAHLASALVDAHLGAELVEGTAEEADARDRLASLEQDLADTAANIAATETASAQLDRAAADHLAALEAQLNRAADHLADLTERRTRVVAAREAADARVLAVRLADAEQQIAAAEAEAATAEQDADTARTRADVAAERVVSVRHTLGRWAARTPGLAEHAQRLAGPPPRSPDVERRLRLLDATEAWLDALEAASGLVQPDEVLPAAAFGSAPGDVQTLVDLIVPSREQVRELLLPTPPPTQIAGRHAWEMKQVQPERRRQALSALRLYLHTHAGDRSVPRL